jgi:serine/threonine protein phosphatase PrpC
MRLRYARLTTAGPIREINEDFLDFWESDDPLVREKQGSVALLADGVGGLDRGEVASRLAVEEALRVFRATPPGAEPSETLKRMFSTACAKIHDTALEAKSGRSMATTLVASIVRNGIAYIANVGDTRAYLIRQRQIFQLSKDHVATALPVKLGLMLERQAMASRTRSELTRSLGVEPFCQPDFATEILQHADFIVHCTDGLHAYVLNDEICAIVSRNHPYDACKQLVALAEKRGCDDNISLQLLEVRDWERAVNPSSPRHSTKSRVPAKSAPVSAASELSPGMTLDGRFELTDLIARSNMASIFKANDRQTGQAVAIKVPLMALESDVAGFERFQREEEIGTRLSHPGVLKVIKVEGQKSRPYLVMEFLDGETLASLLEKRKPFPETEAVRYASQICAALDYLHTNGVTHRDLKPQNIMVCRDGSLRLFDFGIARVNQARRLTFVGFTPAMGTPDYMAPEQVKGRRGDHRTDIYSLGAILYEMTTGSTLFQGESPYVVMNARLTGDPVAPRQVNEHLTPVIQEIILHALERDPEKRYASAGEMKRELDDYEIVQLSERHLHLRSPQPWKSKLPMALLIVGVILAQVLLFLAMFLYFKSKH